MEGIHVGKSTSAFSEWEAWRFLGAPPPPSVQAPLDCPCTDTLGVVTLPPDSDSQMHNINLILAPGLQEADLLLAVSLS